MSNVSLEVGGRVFTVAAADGEEAHIAMLGRMIAERAGRVGGGPGTSETRMLLFAALMLADELHDAHLKEAPPPLSSSPIVPADSSGDAGQISEQVKTRIEELAARVEKLAAHLEEPAQGNRI